MAGSDGFTAVSTKFIHHAIPMLNNSYFKQFQSTGKDERPLIQCIKYWKNSIWEKKKDEFQLQI